MRRCFGFFIALGAVFALKSNCTAQDNAPPIFTPRGRFYDALPDESIMNYRVRVVPLATWVPEKHRVPFQSVRHEVRECRYQVMVCTPVTRRVRRFSMVYEQQRRIKREHRTVYTPTWRDVERRYSVRVPTWREQRREYQVMVSHQEVRQATKKVCKMLPHAATRTVCKDMGHWEERSMRCSDCQIQTCRVWVPNLVEVHKEYTVYKPTWVEVPYEYTTTVQRPESRTYVSKICEYETQQRTRVDRVCEYRREIRIHEVPYTVSVPRRVVKEYDVTNYEWLPEIRVKHYTVQVPFTDYNEYTVDVLRSVPTKVRVAVYE